MRRLLLSSCLILAALPRLAGADGVNLSWVNCAGASDGVGDLTFDCNSETQTFTMVGSFVPPGGISQLSGEDVFVDFVTDKPALPDWWRMETMGCRPGTLLCPIPLLPLTGCADYWGGDAAGGFNYLSNTGTGRGTVEIIAARPSTELGPVTAGQEYYAFELVVKSQGTLACGGCRDGLCAVVRSITLTQPTGMGDYVITNSGARNFVTWQGGSSNCPGAHALKRTTWGRMKDHYR
jgi:hypothetical protein